MKRTKHAVYDLPFQYRRIGELRYAKSMVDPQQL